MALTSLKLLCITNLFNVESLGVIIIFLVNGVWGTFVTITTKIALIIIVRTYLRISK